MRTLHANTRYLSLLAVLAIAAAGGAHAADAGYVDVGGERKPTHATVRAMTAGDTGCYLTLDDGSGGETEQLAAFEICEREAELVGKRVQFTYSVENVLAAECQGDMDCGKSDQVVIVSEAQPVP